jgi:hypothetical protein
MQTLSLMKPRLYFIDEEQAGSQLTESNGAMYVLEHLKELDRSTGRRYALCGGSAPSVSVAWRGGLCSVWRAVF